MEIEFTLNLVVKGNSLDEVDDGLIKAAGQRLIARTQQKVGAAAMTPIVPPNTLQPGTPIGPQPMPPLPPGELPEGLSIKIDNKIAHQKRKSKCNLPAEQK